MKKWKIYEISLFILSCVLMNFIGRMVAEHFSLPLWLDTMGTAMSAYIGGPVAGALVGLTGSFLYAIKSGTTFAFAQTNLILGLFIGLAVKKYGMKNLVSIIMLGGLSAALAVFISVPLDILYNDGMTGNVWGNGVLLYLQERNFPHLLCLISGAAFVDFPDKLITMLAMFASLRIHQLLKNEERAAHEPMTLEGEALDALHEAEAEMKREAAQAADAHIVIDTGEEDGSAKGEKSKKNGILRRFGKRRNTAGIFLLLLMLTFVFQAAVMQTAAQAAETEYNDYVQTVYSSSNGLPCGEANDIAQTNDGILWIGTYAGLYRYNGSDFRWMDDYDSVRNVNCLYVDKEGRLWIGTNDKGLSIMIDEKIVNVVDSTEGLPSDSVRCIAQSADGYYYVGTTGSMQILSLNSGLKRINTLWEVNYADDISADTKGYVAVVTSDGRLFLIRDGVILSSLQLSAQNGVFTCCEFTPDGQLLAGTSDGVMETYDISSETFEKREEIECQGLRSLNDFSFLDDGSLFITADNGIGYIDTDHTFHNIQVNDFDNSIDNMLVDYQGNFWYTSTRLGLLRLSASPFRNVFSSAGLEPKVVNTVEKWGEDYYIGTDSGLDIVNEDCSDTIENELTAQLEGIRIRCLFTDSRGDLWICTYGKGLWQVHPDGKIVLYNAENGSFGDRARMVTELSDGSILAAGNTGISFIRDEKVLKTIGYADGLINSMILTVVELPDGRILAGTDGDGIAVQ